MSDFASPFQPHHQGIIIDFEWQHPQWALSICCTVLWRSVYIHLTSHRWICLDIRFTNETDYGYEPGEGRSYYHDFSFNDVSWCEFGLVQFQLQAPYQLSNNASIRKFLPKTEVLFPEPSYQLADYSLRYSETMVRSRCRCCRTCLPRAIIQGVRFFCGVQYLICLPSMKSRQQRKIGEDGAGTAITFK